MGVTFYYFLITDFSPYCSNSSIFSELLLSCFFLFSQNPTAKQAYVTFPNNSFHIYPSYKPHNLQTRTSQRYLHPTKTTSSPLKRLIHDHWHPVQGIHRYRRPLRASQSLSSLPCCVPCTTLYTEQKGAHQRQHRSDVHQNLEVTSSRLPEDGACYAKGCAYEDAHGEGDLGSSTKRWVF